MIIKQTFNAEEIKDVLCHPEIFPEIKGDYDIKPEDFDPPLEDTVYFVGYEEELIGVCCYHGFKDGLKIHPNVLPKYRLKYGRGFVSLCVSMIECPLYAEIPNHRKRLLNLAKKLGFDSIANNSAKTLLVKR